MIVCPKCGEENAERAKFCAECGSRLQSRPTPSQEARKTVTILFSDLVGSTALGEHLDSEALREVLDRYFTEMKSVLEGHGGIIEAYAGDAIMAIFGLPRVHEDDALRAVTAAMEMATALASLNRDLDATYGVTLSNRTGVNTGEVVVGDPSSGQRLATGDAINVAARLEQAAATNEVLIGEPTHRLARDSLTVERVEPLSLKGKAQPMPAYRLVKVTRNRSAIARRWDAPLVGRRQELEFLRHAFDRAVLERKGHLVTVVGEPGIGKTRLITEMTTSLHGAATTLTGRCLSYGANVVFWPLAEVVRQAAGITEDDSSENARSKLGSVAPGVDVEVIGGRVASLVGLSESVFPLEEALWATAKFFESLSQSSPVVVVFEDLHWAQPLFLDLVAQLREETSGPMLVVCSARPELLERRADWSTAVRSERLRLTSLPRAESDTLLSNLLGTADLDVTTRSRIAAASEGNPLFVEQLISMWLEDATLQKRDGRWVLHPDTGEVIIPPSLSALLTARIDALSNRERATLAAASVMGQVFYRDALEHLCRLRSGPEDRPQLDSLMTKELVAPTASSLPGHQAFAFLHALVRDATYQAILKRTRGQLHWQYADWLEVAATEPGDYDEIIGFHLERAFLSAASLGVIDDRSRDLALRAAWRLTAAGHRAVSVGDDHSASALLTRAGDMFSQGDPLGTEANIDLADHLGDLAIRLGQWQLAIEVLERFAGCDRASALSNLGVATCKLHRGDPRGNDYREGQRFLELSVALERDPDTLASLAGTWKAIDDNRAWKLYGDALEVDPAHPYSLGNYLEYETVSSGTLDGVVRRRDQVEAAILHCREQADEGTNLPWAFYDMAKFHLLVGQAVHSLIAHAKAVQLSTAAYMIETSYASLARLVESAHQLPGYAWVDRLLSIALASRFSASGAIAALGAEASDGPRMSLPVVIVTGGSRADLEAETRRYYSLLEESFEHFTGVLVSGGTTQGVSALVGRLRDKQGPGIKAIGYLPAVLPAGVTEDGRYDEIRRTCGSDFGPWEPLQYWTDLVSSGIHPKDVKLIDIGGGTVSAAELRIALALGAHVGVVRNSGRAANDIGRDRDWVASRTLSFLEPDAAALRAFLTPQAHDSSPGTPHSTVTSQQPWR